MRYQRRASKLKLITEISITPLMDLVFILLFAFMVAVPLVTQFDVSRQAARAESKLATTPPAPEETFTLGLTEEGTFFWAGNPIAFEALPSEVKQALETMPALGVVIHLHPDRSAQDLVRLMTLLDDVGVSRTAIQLTTAPTATPPTDPAR